MDWKTGASMAANAIIEGVDSLSAELNAKPGDANGSGYGNVIMRSENVEVSGLESDESLSELILTDKSLVLDIYVNKSIFNRRHRYEYLPLGEVMCQDGVPCVEVVKRRLSEFELQVEFKHATQVFVFTSHQELNTNRWADAISKEVSRIREASLARKRARESAQAKQGSQADQTASAEKTNPDGQTVAVEQAAPEQFKPGSQAGKADEAKQAATVAAEVTAMEDAPIDQPFVKPTVKVNYLVGRCKACHAPLSGEEGCVITCSYCDTKQTL